MTVSNASLFNPFELTPDVDRYAIFARFRDAAPFARGVKPFPAADEPYYAFSHRLIEDVLRHPDMLQAPPGDYLKIRGELASNSFWTMMFRTILLADPPRHGELRRFMSKDFSSRAVTALEAALRAKADELAAKFRADGGFDVVTDFAVPFIFAGLEQILGISLEDPVWLKRLTASLADGLDFTTETERISANLASEEILAHIETLVPSRSSGSGLMSVLLRMREEGALSQEDLVTNIVFLLFAGQETIVDMIGNAVMALYENPGQAALVRSGADLVKAADELLRYEGSVQFTGARIAARDLQFGEMTVPAGTGVVGVIGSGSRDGEAYEGADRLDVTRSTQVSSLAFGWGPHICIGRNVARMELQIALETLYRSLPGIELDEGRARRRNAIIWRGMATAPVRIV